MNCPQNFAHYVCFITHWVGCITHPITNATNWMKQKHYVALSTRHIFRLSSSHDDLTRHILCLLCHKHQLKSPKVKFNWCHTGWERLPIWKGESDLLQKFQCSLRSRRVFHIKTVKRCHNGEITGGKQAARIYHDFGAWNRDILWRE